MSTEDTSPVDPAPRDVDGDHSSRHADDGDGTVVLGGGGRRTADYGSIRRTMVDLS